MKTFDNLYICKFDYQGDFKLEIKHFTEENNLKKVLQNLCFY